MDSRIIAHLDMDAFFASVEERDKPYLAGVPLVIGADPKGGAGRGVVSTASYAAREYGVKSALPISKAWQLCEAARQKGLPSCTFVTPTFKRYGKASEEVFTIVRSMVPVVEQTSVDEAYVDLSFTGSFEEATQYVLGLKERIKRECRLTCSVGVGPNRMIAKIASDMHKPDGLTVVPEHAAEAFLEPLPITAIPGIGRKTAELFARKRVRTIADAKQLSWMELEHMFGKYGFSIYERLRAIHETPVGVAHERKSIGRHHTFEEDTRDMAAVFSVLRHQAARIVRDMHEEGFHTFRTVVVTMRFDDFDTKTRSLTLDTPAATADELERKAIKLALPFFDSRDNPRKKAIRLAGLRVEKLI